MQVDASPCLNGQVTEWISAFGQAVEAKACMWLGFLRITERPHPLSPREIVSNVFI